jgi:hypothetical protein
VVYRVCSLIGMSSDRWYFGAPVQILFLIAIIWSIIQLIVVGLWPFLLIFLVCILLAIPVVIWEWQGKM